jgi:hypothetical protein
MLVKYKTMAAVASSPGASTGYTLLFDESAGAANEQFAPSFTDFLLKTSGYGAASNIKIPLSNTEGSLPLKWANSYASETAAAAALASFRSTFKGVPMCLQITYGSTVFYLPNANLATTTFNLHGVELSIAATFSNDDVTSSVP